MNKPVYLDFSILQTSRTLMYELWYGYIKPKYQNNAKLCYMDTGSFIIHTKTEDFYKDIAGDIEKRYDISNYEVDRPLPKGMNKKAIDLMKDELERMILTEFVALRSKACIYLSLMIVKTAYLRMKSYQNHNKDLKMKDIVYILKKSIRLH